MQYPIKYIENNLVWNHDGECFAYYELIPYNYSFLSVEQKEAVHDAFRQLIAQNRDGKIHALQISTESSIRAAQERSKAYASGNLREAALRRIDGQTEALVSMIGENQVDYRFYIGFKLLLNEQDSGNIGRQAANIFSGFLRDVNHTLMGDFASMPNDEILRYQKMEKLLESKISRRHVDLAFGFGKKFRAAPDVEIQYIFSDSYILYAQGKGGRLQNDFRRLETITPYGITNQQLDNTYEQLNAAIGFKASPVSGLWFNLYGGYQDLKNDLIDTPTVKSDGISNVFLTEDTKNLYAGADLSYNYKDVFYLAANAVYRHWTTDSDGSDVVVSFKPSVEGNLNLKVHPISPLLVGIGYQHISRQGVEGNKADPVSNLYLNGSYELFKGISVYARVNNLLNKDYQYYWGYPSEGLSFLGGVSFLF